MAKVSSEIVTVTPAMAKKWLAEMRHNRSLRPGVVERYAKAMVEDKWKLTHQGIAFDDHGQLMDGQHRLNAVVTSGKTVKMMVTHGVAQDTFTVVDDGASRATRDLITIAIPGQTFPTEIASIARGMLDGFGGHNSAISKQEVFAFALECKDHIEPYIQLQKKLRSGVASAFANADYSAGIPRELLVETATALLKLDFKGDKDPVKLLYKRVTSNTGNRADAVSLRYRLTVSALRAVVEGRQIATLVEAQRDWDVHEFKKLKKAKKEAA